MDVELKLLTEPTVSILGITETKNFLKVEHTEDDDLIEDIIIPAAVSFVEDETYIDTSPRQWQQNQEGDVEEIELYKGPVLSVDEIKYYEDFDSTGSLLTESTDFRIAGQNLVHVDNFWDKQRKFDGYQIKYTTGLFTSGNYTSSTDPRLAKFKKAALRFAAWLYENREMYVVTVNESFSVNYNYDDVPPEVIRLLRPHMRDCFM
jgi:uncharacterized phiE125 gp8 family phage protein